MADTTVSANVTQKQWEDGFFREYIRNNRFRRYMGTNENAVIQLKEDLTKKPGDALTFQLVSRLQGAGVEGNTQLEGAEEVLGNFGHQVQVTTRRNGVLVTDEEQQKTNIQLLNAARSNLMDWAMEHTRDQIITALGAIGTADGENTAYGSASEGDKDTWLTNNNDRVLFGDAKGNTAAGDHSASLGNVTAAMTFSAAIVSLMKRIAKTADPHIRPIRTAEDEEWFVVFADSLSFRDLKEDTVMAQANREARARGLSNPLFRDGDLVYDGCIIREIPEIASLGGVGATSATVSPVYLCGAQAVGIAWAMRWASRIDTRDYQFRRGVAIQGNYNTEKLFFQSSQNGVVTGYMGAAADA